jgi:chorismate--pyruvate lyase
MADEARALGLRLGAWAWIREVQLLGDGQPWVFARTLIPADTLRGRGPPADPAGNPTIG